MAGNPGDETQGEGKFRRKQRRKTRKQKIGVVELLIMCMLVSSLF